MIGEHWLRSSGMADDVVECSWESQAEIGDEDRMLAEAARTDTQAAA